MLRPIWCVPCDAGAYLAKLLSVPQRLLLIGPGQIRQIIMDGGQVALKLEDLWIVSDKLPPKACSSFESRDGIRVNFRWEKHRPAMQTAFPSLENACQPLRKIGCLR